MKWSENFSVKVNEVFIYATIWMYLENIILSERNQSKRLNIV